MQARLRLNGTAIENGEGWGRGGYFHLGQNACCRSADHACAYAGAGAAQRRSSWSSKRSSPRAWAPPMPPFRRSRCGEGERASVAAAVATGRLAHALRFARLHAAPRHHAKAEADAKAGVGPRAVAIRGAYAAPPDGLPSTTSLLFHECNPPELLHLYHRRHRHRRTRRG